MVRRHVEEGRVKHFPSFSAGGRVDNNQCGSNKNGAVGKSQPSDMQICPLRAVHSHIRCAQPIRRVADFSNNNKMPGLGGCGGWAEAAFVADPAIFIHPSMLGCSRCSVSEFATSNSSLFQCANMQ